MKKKSTEKAMLKFAYRPIVNNISLWLIKKTVGILLYVIKKFSDDNTEV